MNDCDASIVIAAPSEAAWRVLADVVAWPQWLPTVDSVEALDGTALAPGHRYAVRQPRLRPATWTVTELDPPHRFAWQARSPGLVMTAIHAVSETAAGSRVDLRYSFSGPLGTPMAWCFLGIARRYLALEAESLKRVVEAGGHGTGSA